MPLSGSSISYLTSVSHTLTFFLFTQFLCHMSAMTETTMSCCLLTITKNLFSQQPLNLHNFQHPAQSPIHQMLNCPIGPHEIQYHFNFKKILSGQKIAKLTYIFKLQLLVM